MRRASSMSDDDRSAAPSGEEGVVKRTKGPIASKNSLPRLPSQRAGVKVVAELPDAGGAPVSPQSMPSMHRAIADTDDIRVLASRSASKPQLNSQRSADTLGESAQISRNPSDERAAQGASSDAARRRDSSLTISIRLVDEKAGSSSSEAGGNSKDTSKYT